MKRRWGWSSERIQGLEQKEGLGLEQGEGIGLEQGEEIGDGVGRGDRGWSRQNT